MLTRVLQSKEFSRGPASATFSKIIKLKTKYKNKNNTLCVYATVVATKSELGVYIIRHVAVADCSHGDHGPPECVRDGFEETVLRSRLGEVDGTREQHDTCKERTRGYFNSLKLYLMSP